MASDDPWADEGRPRLCPVCGAEDFACRPKVEPGKFVVNAPPPVETPWRSTERVIAPDEEGVDRLVYAEGDPIPEEEARRQGLLTGGP